MKQNWFWDMDQLLRTIKKNNDDFKTFNTDIMRVIYCGSSDFPISTRFGALWIPEFDRIWYSLLYFEYTCLCLTKSENGR